MPTYSNANVNAAAAAVAAPYGPLTRVTDMTTLATPNDRELIEFTDAAGNTIWARYEEVVDAERIAEILAEANSPSSIAHKILTELTAILAAVPLANNGQYTEAQYRTVVERVQAIQATRNHL